MTKGIPKIKKCIIWSNGMVSSFDMFDNQVSECQGFILNIADTLKQYCDKDTKFQLGKWNDVLLDADFSWFWIKKKTSPCK